MSAFQNTAHKNGLSQKEASALLRDIQKNDKDHAAHLKLGRHYNQIREWEPAKKHLLKSYALTLSQKDNKVKAGILYELAQTYRAIGEISACEDALKGVKNLITHQSEIRNSVLLQLSEILYLQNRFNEASAQLAGYDRKAESLQYKQLSSAIAKAIEIDKIYIEAVDAEYEGNLERARSLYQKIDGELSGFKDVQERLNNVRKELLLEERQTSAAPENTIVHVTANGSHYLAKMDIAADTPATQDRQAHEDTRQNSKKTTRAKQKKQNPEPAKAIPKSAQKREVTSSIKSVIIESPSKEAVDRLSQTKEPIALVSKDLTPPVVHISIPKNQPETPAKKEGRKRHIWAVTLFAGVVLTGTGLTIYFNPFFRARTLTLIGRKQTALALYENLIAQKPQMLWLYPNLAKLYDHFNRQDSKAIRIYKIIQHLSMHSNTDNSFAATISNKYLSQEKTDVKIEIIEKNRF